MRAIDSIYSEYEFVKDKYFPKTVSSHSGRLNGILWVVHHVGPHPKPHVLTGEFHNQVQCWWVSWP